MRATPRISPLIDGGVVVVAVLLVNSGLIEISRTPGIIALGDGGSVVATVLLADGVGVVIISSIATTERVIDGVVVGGGLVDGDRLAVTRYVKVYRVVVCNHIAAHAIKGRENGKVQQVSVDGFICVYVHGDPLLMNGERVI